MLNSQNQISVTSNLWQPENAVAPYKSLDLNGLTVIRSCHSQRAAQGGLFTHSHLLFVVVSGEITIEYGAEKIAIEKGAAVFIKKNSRFAYKKTAAQNQPYHSLLFFFDDELLHEFNRSRRKFTARTNEDLSAVKIKSNSSLLAFAETVNSYFDEQLSAEPELLRLKMLEILFVVTAYDAKLSGCFAQFNTSDNADLARLMETEFNQNLSLTEFARKSGRSLSKFKRDFQATFAVPPQQWLRENRLDYARRMLTTTDKTVSDVCYEAGFENLSHFSRLFKQHFGCRPSCVKKNRTAQ
ncbi:MAG: helix-turn-helix transcriptional regulator [Pyrinomonadaceae bacterium]|nr:helix-turn-helix transcriptional regulator [Pyrinomonadaceae bacterium]